MKTREEYQIAPRLKLPNKNTQGRVILDYLYVNLSEWSEMKKLGSLSGSFSPHSVIATLRTKNGWYIAHEDLPNPKGGRKVSKYRLILCDDNELEADDLAVIKKLHKWAHHEKVA